MGLPLLSTFMLVPCQFILCSVADLNPRRYSGTAVPVLLMDSDPILIRLDLLICYSILIWYCMCNKTGAADLDPKLSSLKQIRIRPIIVEYLDLFLKNLSELNINTISDGAKI